MESIGFVLLVFTQIYAFDLSFRHGWIMLPICQKYAFFEARSPGCHPCNIDLCPAPIIKKNVNCQIFTCIPASCKFTISKLYFRCVY